MYLSVCVCLSVDTHTPLRDAGSLLVPKCASSLDIRWSVLLINMSAVDRERERSEISVWESENDSVNPPSDVSAARK